MVSLIARLPRDIVAQVSALELRLHKVHADFFFFFQAEDGIRDVAVTGVQTCALPIFIGINRSKIAIDNLEVNLSTPSVNREDQLGADQIAQLASVPEPSSLLMLGVG